MRDIIVIRGKCTFKTAKGHQFKENKKKKNKKKEKKERQWRIRLERGVQNLEETIIFRWPVAISLESTVGSCLLFAILFFSHSSTNGPEGFEGKQSV
jgi:hypothetical protein